MTASVVFDLVIRIRIICLMLFGLMLGACSDTADVRPGVPVIVYVIDGLRADRLGGNASAAASLKNLEKLMTESVVFDAAYATSPWALPSVTSMLTSTWPCQHQVLDTGRRLGSKPRTLADGLGEGGYRTIAMVGSPLVSERFGLTRGFDVFEAPVGTYQYVEFTEHQAATEKSSAGPLFLYLHTNEPQIFFETPKKFTQLFGSFETPESDRIKALWLSYHAATTVDIANGQPRGSIDNAPEQELFMTSLRDLQPRIEMLYDASVHFADDRLGEVIRRLNDSGAWDNAIFILTSTHGTGLGEHGGWSNEQALYEEQIRVPLIIRFPGAEYAGTQINAPVSLVDIMPTIFDVLGVPSLCRDCRGRSLLELLAMSESADDAKLAAEATIISFRDDRRTHYGPWQERHGSRNVALRKGDWKAIWNAEPATLELYSLAPDPSEQNDVGAGKVQLAGELRVQAEHWYADCQTNAVEVDPAAPADARMRKKLESAGYFE